MARSAQASATEATDGVNAVLAKLKRGSELREEIEMRVRYERAKGRGPDEIAAALGPSLAGAIGLPPADCSQTIRLLAAAVH